MKKEITLLSVFSKSEESLRKVLQTKRLPSQYSEVQQIISNHITMLLNGDNEFKMSLNHSDVQILNAALRMALAFGKLSLSEAIDYNRLSRQPGYSEPETASQSTDHLFKTTLLLLPTVVCAFIHPWVAAAVGGVSVFVKSRIDRNSARPRQQKNRVEYRDISKSMTPADIDNIIGGIKSICTEVDNLIVKIHRDRAELSDRAGIRLADATLDKMYPQLIVSLQYLYMSNVGEAQENQHIKNLLFNMEGYGYKVVDCSDENSGYFSKTVNPNVSAPTQYLPAVIYDDGNGMVRLVKEGVLYIPKQQ